MRFIVLVPLLLSLSACSARQSNQPHVNAKPDAGPDYDPSTVSVPFLVDDHFIPSGCMGDCAKSVVIDSNCPTRGTSDAQGECHHFVFDPNTDAAAFGWAGVLWQTSEKNWGSLPGRVVEPGAKLMHFYAAGKVGGESLDILVGGMIPADSGKACDASSVCSSLVCEADTCTAPHHDTLNVSRTITLSKDFQEFEIPFGDRSYAPEVMSGFGWTAQMPPGHSGIEFFVDDLRWE